MYQDSNIVRYTSDFRKENRADYLQDFHPYFPAWNEQSLSGHNLLTYIHLCKSVQLQSAASAVKHAEM